MYSFPKCFVLPSTLYPMIKGCLLLLSRSVMSDSLWPHGLQHARLSCPSPSPRACSNSCPSSWWSIQSSHPLSSPSLAFSLSQHQGLFQWVSSSHQGAKLLVSSSASVLPKNIQDWFPLGLNGLISLQYKALKNLLQHHSSKASILWHSAFFGEKKKNT